MKVNSGPANEIIKEFGNLLVYHIRKLEQLVKIDRAHAFELKYMLHALKGSLDTFQASEQPLQAIRECVSTIVAGQPNADEGLELLPIQQEILDEMELFLIRYNLK